MSVTVLPESQASMSIRRFISSCSTSWGLKCGHISSVLLWVLSLKLRRPLTVSGAHQDNVCSWYVRKACGCMSVYCTQLAIRQFVRWVWKPKQLSDSDSLPLQPEKTFLFWTSLTTPFWQRWSNYSSGWEQIWWIFHPQTHTPNTHTHKRKNIESHHMYLSQKSWLYGWCYNAVSLVQFSNAWCLMSQQSSISC